MGIFVTDVKERCPDQWNHLLSDSSLDELHRFAGEIGIERDAFQPRTGVYALDETGRDAALDFGATNLPSMLDGKINPAMGRKFSKAMKLSNSLR